MKLNIIVLKHLSAAQKAVQAAHVAEQFAREHHDEYEYQDRYLDPTIILREADLKQLNAIDFEFNSNTSILYSLFEEDFDMGIGPLTAVAVGVPEPWPPEWKNALLDISKLPLV